MREKYAVNSLDWKYCTCCSTLPQLFMSKNSLSPNQRPSTFCEYLHVARQVQLPQISPQTPEKNKRPNLQIIRKCLGSRGPTNHHVMKKTPSGITDMPYGHGLWARNTPAPHSKFLYRILFVTRGWKLCRFSTTGWPAPQNYNHSSEWTKGSSRRETRVCGEQESLSMMKDFNLNR